MRTAMAWVVLALMAIPASAEPKGDKPAKPKKPRITISRETTSLTAPLRPDGYVDYLAALNQRFSQGVTPENNAAVLLHRAVGPVVNKELRGKYFEMLGIAELPEKGGYFVDLHDFVKARGDTLHPADDAVRSPADVATDQLTEASRRPWSEKEFPVLAAWLVANQKPLNLMVEGSRRPRCYTPKAPDGKPLLYLHLLSLHISETRAVTRALQTRAMLRLHGGKLQEAWQDLLACHRWARLVEQEPFLIDFLVAGLLETKTCENDAALAHYGHLSSAQARQFEADLAALPPISKIADTLDFGERLFYLDAVAEAARNRLSDIPTILGAGPSLKRLPGILDALAMASIDWDEPMRMGNQWYNRVVAALRISDQIERAKAIAAINRDLEETHTKARDVNQILLDIWKNGIRKALGRQLGQCFVGLLIPAFRIEIPAEDRFATMTNHAQIALALAAYRADRGVYPERLAQLTPKYLPEVPKDRFTGGELIYRRVAEGYLLYSVGPDGKDDGGRGLADPTEPPDSPADDIRLEMPVRKNP